jgi:hypothetical protein
MIFSISIGSAGDGEERYVLYAPFVLGPGRDIVSLDEPLCFPVGNYEGKLEKLTYRYALSLGPFSKEEAALDFLPRLKAALLWFSLRWQVGLQYPKEASKVQYYDEPVHIGDESSLKGLAEVAGWEAADGNYDANQLVVLADHKRLTRFEPGNVAFHLGMANTKFADSISEALSFPSIARIAELPKLQLAIELYGGYAFELTDNAQFVTLVTSLEALLPDVANPEHVIQCLRKAKDYACETRNSYKMTDPKWDDLNRLMSRIGNLETESIGHTLRQYAADAARRAGTLGNPDEIAARLNDTYNTRSRLLHDGVADIAKIKDNLGFLREFVPNLLRFLFRETAGQ